MVPVHVSPTSAGGEIIQQKPLLRRPTLVRKFADANLGEDQDPQTPSSPAKRTRVAFNNEVEINLVEEWDKAPEIIREEVRRALERHRNGDDTQYDKIKQVFVVDSRDGKIASAATIRNYTAALLSSIALIDKSCFDLLQLVLKSDWLRRDDSYLSLYQRLMGNLVLSHSMWLNPVLHMLVDNFLQAPIATATTASLSPITNRQIRLRVHKSLQSLLKLIPTASQALGHILTTRFPYMDESKRVHVRYVHNLLRIVEYAPELRSEILNLITDRVVKIDVQVQVDIEDLADDIGEDIVKTIPRSTEELVDESGEDSSDEESDEESAAPETDEQRAKKISSNVEKLDILLDISFEYYTNLFADPSTQETAFDTLLAHFNSTILPTYQSRHTQFLLFHFTQTSHELIDIFIGILLRTISDKTRAPLVRQTAASYLGSFVARGNHVPASIVQDVFDYISVQLDQIRALHMPDYRGPDPRRYSTYYALCQALLYIFCFRWRDLRVMVDDARTPSPGTMLYADGFGELEENTAFIPIVKETLLLHCFKSLNPLKVCSPSIVNEFARITHRLGVLYIYPLLEQNRRIRIVNAAPVDRRETALSNRRGDEWQGLDAYFPFDPYKLPRSKRWLEGDYREWQPIVGLEDDADDVDESESDGEKEETSDFEGTGTEGEA